MKKVLEETGEFLLAAGFLLFGIIPAMLFFVYQMISQRGEFLADFIGETKKHGFFYLVFSVCYTFGSLLFFLLRDAVWSMVAFIPNKIFLGR